MRTLFLASKAIKFSPADLVGEGGEAEVYRMGSDRAVKVFKQESHPDFTHLPQMKRIAAEKHLERQKKLRAFPRGLPDELVLPQDFLFDRPAGGEILAYSMLYLEGANPLINLSCRDFRESRGIDEKQLLEIFAGMHITLGKLHSAGAVVGDLNGLNVLLRGKIAYFIDTDSMQFGRYLCTVFCSRYVDPLLCDPAFKQPVLVRPLNVDSDWYAYAVLLFESLLYVHPFGGVHRPRDPAARVGPEERALRHISVMHPEVQYPSCAVPLSSLNKDLLEYFEAVFVDGYRRPLPVDLLERICPQLAVHTASKPSLTRETEMSFTPVFKTGGRILHAVVQSNRLHYLYWENSKFVREDGQAVLSGPYDSDFLYKISSADTVIGKRDSIYLLSSRAAPEHMSVELFRDEFPVFDCNEEACFWLDGGKIWRHDKSAARQVVQEVLANQTRIWIGPEFGFGFYQAGQFKRSFLFDCSGASRFNLPDGVIVGNVLAAECFFSPAVAWIFTTLKQGKELINSCTAVDVQGNILASEEKLFSDDGWLARIQGKCGAGRRLAPDASLDFLLSTTNGGIAQIGIELGRFVELRTFDVPAVNTDDKLIHSERGLYIWNSNEIRLLSTRPKTLAK